MRRIEEPDTEMTKTAIACGGVVLAALTVGTAPLAWSQDVQESPDASAGKVELVMVVGCLRQDTGDVPWVLDRATEGTPASTPYTSEEEVSASADLPLGSLEYRLVGSGPFDVERHVGHRVQAKGLRLTYEGERRLNLTSFQHVAPSCEG